MWDQSGAQDREPADQNHGEGGILARASILRARLGRAVHSNILISEVTVSRGFAISRLRWDARFTSIRDAASAQTAVIA
jgi:hypothetical protein